MYVITYALISVCLRERVPGMPLVENHMSDSKVHGANIGPIWGRQDPGGPHVGPMNFAIWDVMDFKDTTPNIGNHCHPNFPSSLNNILDFAHYSHTNCLTKCFMTCHWLWERSTHIALRQAYFGGIQYIPWNKNAGLLCEFPFDYISSLWVI